MSQITMSDIITKEKMSQAKYFNNIELQDMIKKIEDRYKFIDETLFFNTLVNFSTSKNTPYQRWVRYREGYSTLLVEELIKRSDIDPSKHFVSDPMMGSGTSILAALKLGYDSFGLDVNPYSKVILDAKLTRPEKDLLNDLKEFSSNISLGDNSKAIFREHAYNQYFPEENLKKIHYLREEINKIKQPKLKQIALAAWYFILEDSSNRKKDGNGLSTRPSPVSDVIAYYLEKLNQMIDDYLQFPLDKEPVFESVIDSALNFSENALNFADKANKKLGSVIFSPPYANSFNYFESYKVELLFGGLFTEDEFGAAKKSMIRNYRISTSEFKSEYEVIELLCKEVEEAIPIKEKATGKKDTRTRLIPNMLRYYFLDMENVLKEILKVLESGGKCFIVVDQSAYVGKIIPTDTILAFIGESIGFKVEYVTKCRRALTSGQQMKQFPYLKDSLRETIVVLSKPD